ncbi:hypothetical protein RWE15_10140 [Virgibacillus halophilus]|uniref:Uncharacterized protein n=2 Tax=Tigheibacillus halophilus TaxID=361280 RepID=A0ABU5C5Z1_9BACI|nr:hypothetical protein [Virgibacillus halophilus]
MDESNNTIHKIEFEDDKRYDLVDVFVDDSFKALNKSEKQEFVDRFGGKVMGNVRSRIYHSDTSDKIWVYFKYTDGKMAAEPKTLDKGWKIK